MEYQSGDGAVEDGVTQKFKPFVVRDTVTAVRQRLPQQFGAMEGVTEFSAQRRTLHIPVSCPQFCAPLPPTVASDLPHAQGPDCRPNYLIDNPMRFRSLKFHQIMKALPTMFWSGTNPQ